MSREGCRGEAESRNVVLAQQRVACLEWGSWKVDKVTKCPGGQGVSNNSCGMKAIVLVAGASRRLRAATNGLPKCLVHVNGRPILQDQFEAISEAGVHEVILVVGYRAHLIKEYVASMCPELSVEYVLNPNYENTNTIYSLWLAREKLVDRAFLYLNGDVMADHEITRLLVDATSEMCLAVERKTCGEEEVKVITDGNGRVVRIGKEIDARKAAGEFIGIAKFSGRSEVGFLQALDALVSQGEHTAYFELALDSILSKTLVSEIDVSRFRAVEIDFPEDLNRARMLFRS